jgi:transposase InsO family protein
LAQLAELKAFAAGLPVRLFSDQKSQFGSILEDLGMEIVVIFSGNLEYFKTIEYILWAFGNF